MLISLRVLFFNHIWVNFQHELWVFGGVNSEKAGFRVNSGALGGKKILHNVPAVCGPPKGGEALTVCYVPLCRTSFII